MGCHTTTRFSSLIAMNLWQNNIFKINQINDFSHNINERIVYKIDLLSVQMIPIVLIDLKFIEMIPFYKQFHTCCTPLTSVPSGMIPWLQN